MAGMDALGRVYDVASSTNGTAVSMVNCSGITFIAEGTAASTVLSMNFGTTYAGSYTNPSGFTGVSRYYTRAQFQATGGWTKQTQTAGTQITLPQGSAVAFEILCSQLPDPFEYVKVTAVPTAHVTALLHDLTVQRTPGNLATPSA